MNVRLSTRSLAIIFICLFVLISGCSLKGTPVNSNPPGEDIPPAPDHNGTSIDNSPEPEDETYALIVEPEELVLSANMISQLHVTIENTVSKKSVTIHEPITYQSSNPELVAIDQNGLIEVVDHAITGQRAAITVSFQDQTVQTTVTIKNSLEQTVNVSTDGIPVVSNPDALDVVVNKQRSLPVDFIPPDMIAPDVAFSFSGENEKKLLQRPAAQALEELFAAAKKDNITLYAVSGYRSYATQRSIFNSNVARQGEEEASRFSARPGHSEHQTGLTMDVTGTDPKCLLEQCFENTPEGQWVAENAHHYGFIIRYPKDKEHITEYAFEPWHLRYVGKDLAREITELDLTMEQYFSEAIPVTTPAQAE